MSTEAYDQAGLHVNRFCGAPARDEHGERIADRVRWQFTVNSEYTVLDRDEIRELVRALCESDYSLLPPRGD